MINFGQLAQKILSGRSQATEMLTAIRQGHPLGLNFTRQDAEALLVANIATFDHVIELLNRYASDTGDRALMGDEAKQQLDHLKSELKKLTLQMPTDPSTSATTGSLGDATNNLDEDDAGPGTQ